MTKEKDDVRDQILKSATELLLQKGYSGLRMQELADRAGVNKGALHYYFKGKKNIFHQVLERNIDHVYIDFQLVLREDIAFEERIEKIVGLYLQRMATIPEFPGFLTNEMRLHPELFDDLALVPEVRKIWAMLKDILIAEGYEVKKDTTTKFLVNMMSLTLAPFMMLPMIMKMTQHSPHQLEEMLQGRAHEVAQMVLNTLKKKSQ